MFFEKQIHKFLWWLTESFPDRTRDLKRGGIPYLRRFYLTRRRLDKNGVNTGRYQNFGVYLHYFYRGDEDKELHNHPWKRAISLILTGGYFEERRRLSDNFVEMKFVKPRRLNIIKGNDFHRIIKVPGVKHVWTLFMTCSRHQDWGFWDRHTGKYTPHSEFVTDYDQGYKEKENGEH